MFFAPRVRMIPHYEYTKEMKDIVEEVAPKYEHEPILIQAIIETESSYNQYAQRYEENYPWIYSAREVAEMLGCTRETIINAQKSSFGLMQIMASCCYEMGFKNWPGRLFDIKTNVTYGCKHLRNLIDRQKLKRIDQFYAAYNAGNANKPVNGIYTNQRNVDNSKECRSQSSRRSIP